MSTYLKNFSIGGLTLTFIIVAFTIQWYFLMRIFWTGVNVADSENALYFGDRFNYLRLTKENNRADTHFMLEFTLSEAIACAICMFVALFPNLGKVGPLETLIMCFVGIFGYALNESAFWRLFINDNGYGMRIFLFGSVLGLVSSRILGKKEETRSHKNYYSEYNFQTFGLLGAIFIWILLPWLSTIGQGTFNTADFRQVAPLNIWYALSASCCASFMTSIWIHGKISVHEIVFGCFSVIFWSDLGCNCLWVFFKRLPKALPCHAHWNHCWNRRHLLEFQEEILQRRWCRRFFRRILLVFCLIIDWSHLLSNPFRHSGLWS